VTYKDELQKATDVLAENGYVFFGQNMRAGGTSLFHMIKHLPEEQRIEVPVFEDIQMGMSLGMSLNGMKVCSIFPRWDFLVCAMNQLVNHLDKVRLMSDGQFKAKGLIIRTCVGSVKPLFPGEQHCGDYTDAVRLMCKEINVVKLKNADQIVPAYIDAMNADTPTLIVEIPDMYNVDLIQQLIESRAQKIIR
tara:strand:- start:354 stop:929 length:576 start_codon:yes stop_codon:yes gene_type:complete